MNVITHTTSRIIDGNMSFEHGERATVQKNRETFLQKNNIPPHRVMWAHLEHGDTIQHINETYINTSVIADALTSNTPNIFLACTTSDCIPVVLFDPEHEAVALIHLGWKSSALHLMEQTVRKLIRTFDTNPQKLRAFFGPSIQFDSYIVNNPKQKDAPEWQPFLEKISGDQYRVDLVGFNIQELVNMSAQLEHIDIDETDTYASKEYFSHRRSQETGGPEGRMVTVVGINA